MMDVPCCWAWRRTRAARIVLTPAGPRTRLRSRPATSVHKPEDQSLSAGHTSVAPRPRPPKSLSRKRGPAPQVPCKKTYLVTTVHGKGNGATVQFQSNRRYPPAARAPQPPGMARLAPAFDNECRRPRSRTFGVRYLDRPQCAPEISAIFRNRGASPRAPAHPDSAC